MTPEQFEQFLAELVKLRMATEALVEIGSAVVSIETARAETAERQFHETCKLVAASTQRTDDTERLADVTTDKPTPPQHAVAPSRRGR